MLSVECMNYIIFFRIDLIIYIETLLNKFNEFFHLLTE